MSREILDCIILLGTLVLNLTICYGLYVAYKSDSINGAIAAALIFLLLTKLTGYNRD